MSSVLDASALLAYLFREPGREAVREALARSCAVSAVNWAEVLSKLADRGEEPGAVAERFSRSGVREEGLIVRPMDKAQAVEVARLRPLTRSAGLSLGDRSCLALAAALGLPALTADRAWAHPGLEVEVELIR